MSRDQLLLLAQRAQEAEGVRPKADNRHDREQHERRQCARRHTPSLPPRPRGQHHEWEHEPGGGLHADPDDEQSGCCP
ncbi:MAG TPA: hypothetical protein VNU28_02710, partial [Solirubrobacteraceae bacterium]|nr:hypothetical protein [Solirubrobacteraceae bacterium]